MIKNLFYRYVEPRLKKKIVPGCHDNPTPLLTRYKLIETKWGDLNIHVLHRSDEDRFTHDHPWDFYTLILWKGYLEHLPNGVVRKVKPLRFIKRPAKWQHRIELIDNKPAITLSFMLKKYSDDWGFYTPDGFVHYKKFLKDKGCAE